MASGSERDRRRPPGDDAAGARPSAEPPGDDPAGALPSAEPPGDDPAGALPSAEPPGDDAAGALPTLPASDREASTSPLSPPERIGRFQIKRELGQGAMGRVFLAHDVRLARDVAIKLPLRNDAASRARFEREARAVARLQHDHIVTIYDVAEHEGQPCIVAEYLDGSSLASCQRPMPWQEVLALGLGLADALAAAHRRGVLHRDIKPANVIVTGPGVAKLVDFGLAKLAAVAKNAAEPQAATVEAADAPGRMAAKQSRSIRRAPGRGPQGAGTDARPASASSAPGKSHTDSWLTTTGSDSHSGGAEPPLTSTGADSRSGGAEPPLARTDAAPADRDAGAPLTTTGAVVGTPYYMAPELWNHQPATPASDVYALGVLLYELCTGRVPFHDVPEAGLAHAATRLEAPPLARAAPPAARVDQRLAAVIERCVAREPAARFASGQELFAALAAIAPHGAGRPQATGNPYPGLRAFDRDHRAYFFGRDADIRDVTARLEKERLILIAGESGVGKSSLVRAGVLPWIAEHRLEGAAAWEVCTLLPDQHALAALSAALAPRLGLAASAVRAMLTDDVAAVGQALQRVHGDDAGTIVFVDQLEQLVMLCARDDAVSTAVALAYLAEQVPRVRVLATVRGDQLTRLAHLPGLGPRVERSLYILRPLRKAEVREVAVRPAEACGVAFASASMVDTLVQAALRASGGLPLLQFALSQLWELRDAEEGQIPAAALEQIGGVTGALARHADRVVDGLRSQEAARELLLRLVVLHETRARHTEAALVASDADRRAALEALVAGRLVVASEAEGAPVYEIAHEALLTGWPRLRHWLDEESDVRAAQRRLSFAAAEWARLARPAEALWAERQLREAARIDPDVLGPVEASFLRESRYRVRRRRQRRRMAVLLPFVVLGVIYAAVRHMEERRLRAEIQDLLRRAEPLLAHARERSTAHRRARKDAEALLRQGGLVAGEAAWQRSLRRGAQVMGEAAWTHALALAPEAEDALAKASRLIELALPRAPGRRDVRQALAVLLHEQALLAEAMGRDALRARLVERLGSYADTGELARRWTAATPVEIRPTPAALPVTLHRYQRQAGGTIALVPVGAAQRTPHTWHLTPGSYLLVVSSNGHTAELRHAFRVLPGQDAVAPRLDMRRAFPESPGQDAVAPRLDRRRALPESPGQDPVAPRLEVHLVAPAREQVPKGFVYVPPGWFIFGHGGDELLEPLRQWYKTTPPHERYTEAFLIARHETTYAEWIAFLRALPARERAARMPMGVFDTAYVKLEEIDDAMVLELRALAEVHRAAEGEPLEYAARDRRRSQDWRRFPVTGISGEDARAYLRWLDATGKVPGARLCREDEWERAARGADTRLFPHGDRLAPEDANFDATYGKKDGAYGFDEVGAHPASRSPFGVEDLAGNARELAISILEDPETVLAVRGGDFFRSPRTSAVVNREIVKPAQRIPFVGLRVCANAPAR